MMIKSLLLPQGLRRMLTQLENIECKPPFEVGNDPKRQQKGSFVWTPALVAILEIR
jgi:hypothetical protein